MSKVKSYGLEELQTATEWAYTLKGNISVVRSEVDGTSVYSLVKATDLDSMDEGRMVRPICSSHSLQTIQNLAALILMTNQVTDLMGKEEELDTNLPPLTTNEKFEA